MALAYSETKQHAHELIDRMAPGQVSVAVSLFEIMLDPVSRAIANAPFDDEPVSAEELRRAKEYYKGQLLFALEDTMNHMLWLGEKIISNEKDFSVKSILARIDAVGPEDLMRLAGGMLKNGALNLAVISPIKDDKEIRKVLNIS